MSISDTKNELYPLLAASLMTNELVQKIVMTR